MTQEKSNLTERVEVRVTPADKAILNASADRQGITTSDLVRESALKAAKK